MRINVERDPALVRSACLRVRTRLVELYAWRDGRRLRVLVCRPEVLP